MITNEGLITPDWMGWAWFSWPCFPVSYGNCYCGWYINGEIDKNVSLGREDKRKKKFHYEKQKTLQGPLTRTFCEVFTIGLYAWNIFLSLSVFIAIRYLIMFLHITLIFKPALQRLRREEKTEGNKEKVIILPNALWQVWAVGELAIRLHFHPR